MTRDDYSFAFPSDDRLNSGNSSLSGKEYAHAITSSISLC